MTKLPAGARTRSIGWRARLAWGAKALPRTRVSGVVTEIAMSHYRVAGLSRFLRLGECVSVDVGDRVQLGEVVQDRRRRRHPEAVRRPLRRRDRRARLSGRIAFAEAASGMEGPGDRRARTTDRRRRRPRARRARDAARRRAAARPAARARQDADQVRNPRDRPVHAALRRPAHRRFRRLGSRQVDASVDARSGARFRHRRDRARGRAGPRGARISRRHARRQPPVRRSPSSPPATRAR